MTQSVLLYFKKLVLGLAVLGFGASIYVLALLSHVPQPFVLYVAAIFAFLHALLFFPIAYLVLAFIHRFAASRRVRAILCLFAALIIVSAVYMLFAGMDGGILILLGLALFVPAVISASIMRRVGRMPGHPVVAEILIIFLVVLFSALLLDRYVLPPARVIAWRPVGWREGVSSLGAMQTKIKVAQYDQGRLPLSVTPPGVVSNLVRFVSDADSSPYFDATHFVPLSDEQVAAFEARYGVPYRETSGAQVALEISLEDFWGRNFRNEHYQYRLIHDDPASGNYAYAIAVVGDENSRAFVGSAYAVFVRNDNDQTDEAKRFIVVTYEDFWGEDSDTYRFLADMTIAAEAEAPGAIRLPAWDAEDDEIRSVRVGQHGGRWE